MIFYKYEGTGNDFIMIDNRNLTFNKDEKHIEKLCHRRFGIGADGLILIENDSDFDFKMIYYNADGKEGSMCGNGGRCAVAFAKQLNIIDKETTFIATDGIHHAYINENYIKLKMIDVKSIEKHKEHSILNTGSPHLVKWVKDIENFPVYEEGKKIRYSENFKNKGINVNFIEKKENTLWVRTYERGVENETLSCGTGSCAAAIVLMEENPSSEINIKVLGGELKIYAQKNSNIYENIWLEGPAKKVFKGEILD